MNVRDPRIASPLMIALLSLLALAFLISMALAVRASTSTAAPAQQSALVGVSTHAFGVVDLGANVLPLTHTFVLTNTTSAPVRITHVSTTCGCTLAAADRDVVAAGATVSVTATLHILEVGSKSAQVIVTTDIEMATPVVLLLSGQGWRARQLTCTKHSVELSAGDETRLFVYVVDHQSADAPSAPRVDASNGVAAHVSDWRLVQPFDPGREIPARWEASLSIRDGRDQAQRDAVLHDAGVMIEIVGIPQLNLIVQTRE